MLLSADLLRFGIKSVPERHVLSIRKTLPVGEYRALIAATVAELQLQIEAGRLKAAGAPFAIFHDRLYWDRDVDVSVCIPVRNTMFGKHPSLQTVAEATVAYTEVAAGATENEVRSVADALEQYVCENDWIFEGDLREVYPRGTGGAFEVQMPVER